MKKKWILSLALAISVSTITACGDDQAGDKTEEPKKEETEQDQEKAKEDNETTKEAKMPDPNLDSIPDVVAKVNGEEITKKEFEPVYVNTLNSYAMQGMYNEEQDKNGEMQQQIQQQIVEQMVGQELLIQEADNRELKASEDEVNKELASLKEQFESDKQYKEALKASNVTEEDLMNDIKTQVKIEKLIEEESGKITVSEEELKKSYEQMSKMQGEGENAKEFPSYEEMKPQLESQLKSQKESEEVKKIVEDLRENGDVSVNI